MSVCRFVFALRKRYLELTTCAERNRPVLRLKPSLKKQSQDSPRLAEISSAVSPVSQSLQSVLYVNVRAAAESHAVLTPRA